MPADEMEWLIRYDRLIKWALSHSIAKHGLILDDSTEFNDLVQVAYLRLLSSLSRREMPEHLPSYVVKATRRVVTDYIRERSRAKNAFSKDAPEMLGRVTRNRKLRIARKISPEERAAGRAAASAARWAGHRSAKSADQLANHRDDERRRRERKRIESAGEVSVPRHLARRTRSKISLDERRRRQKEYRVAKVGAMSPEERELDRAYRRQKQAEYRARHKSRIGGNAMPKKYESMKEAFKREGLSDKAAKTKAAKIYNAARKPGQKPVTGKHKP